MSRHALVIARRELARFFSNRISAIVSLLLPGLLIFALWTLMGAALRSETVTAQSQETTAIAVANLPASMGDSLPAAGFQVAELPDVPETTQVRELLAEEGGPAAVVAFPVGFDAQVAAYDTASGAQAPQVAVYYDSSDAASATAYSRVAAFLDAYEQSLSNRFDVNAGDGSYDVADARDLTGSLMVSIAPFLLLVLLFSGCMSVAAESIAGEKERGTMATLLATPIARSDLAWGKIIALSGIGLLLAASSAIGICASLPALAQGSYDLGVYGLADYAALLAVIAATALLVVTLITLVSALARSTKEAQLFLTPLMVVVMAVGLLGMFGGSDAQQDAAFYLIPLYGSVQAMIGLFSFSLPPACLAACLVGNVAYTAVGIAALRRMLGSEQLMFAR